MPRIAARLWLLIFGTVGYLMSLNSLSVRTWSAALAGAFVAGSLFAAAPARALDDGDQSIFDTVKSLLGAGIGASIGIGVGEEQPRINYHERAPLVLPPSNNLPVPAAPVAQRNAAWPKDYDAERVRRSREAAFRARSEDPSGGMNARDIRTIGRLERNRPRDPTTEDCPDGDIGRLCNPTKFWSIMKNTRKADNTTRDLVPGSEPRRASLTDPPTGLRKPTKAVKYTFEIKEEVPLGDPRAQLREEQRRARQVD